MSLKKIFLFFFVFSISNYLNAQILSPAKWSHYSEPKNPQPSDTVTFYFSASIDEGWYLYSSDFDPDLGPLVTTFSFEKNESLQLVGDIVPVSPKKKYDSLWEGEFTFFTQKALFKQKAVLSDINTEVKVNVSYQVCTEIDGKCIPGQHDFTFFTSNTKASSTPSITEDAQGNNTYSTGDDSLISFILFAFLFGIAAVFTPCVFPMLPITVSFFTKQSEKKMGGIKNGILYGLSIVVIYTLIGVIIAPIAGPTFANTISTHWIPNLLFFIVFFAFGLSFLGMFELTLPSSLVTKIDAKSEKGGFLGIFFMALTLIVVSFSCTGPLVGSILVASAGGEIVKPMLGMLAFSIAFAFPFTLFAIFPQWMNKLPKSGGWLNGIKVTLGFLEIALSLKFLSMIDLVYHLNILDRDIMIAIWIALSILLGLYYLGKIRLSHDSPSDTISVGKLLLALFCFSFAIYMIPGMFGASLNALSGILPPKTRSSFDLEKIITSKTLTNTTKSEAQKEIAHGDLFELPHGLKGFFDYQQALNVAKESNKPLFIDFTGHGCANCRKMEDYVWADPKVLDILKKDYVVLALYVDDPTTLPKENWVKSSYDGKTKRTIGEVNMDLQITKFNNNAQPFYILLNPKNEKPIIPPRGYNLNIGEFASFLRKGLANFKN